MNIWAISEAIVLMLLYFCGFSIQYKIISICSREKDGKTWLLHMIYSISTTIYFGFYLPFVIITSEVPDLAENCTGEWFCYLATFVAIFGVTIITFNSLLVAMMKYIFIVQYDMAINYGEQRVQKLFCILYIGFPMFLALFACLTRDFDSYGALNSCFGTTDYIKVKYKGWLMNFAKFFLCDLDKENRYEYGFVIFIIKQALCAIKSSIVFVINTNLPEAMLYYKIFRRMKW